MLAYLLIFTFFFQAGPHYISTKYLLLNTHSMSSLILNFWSIILSKIKALILESLNANRT